MHPKFQRSASLTSRDPTTEVNLSTKGTRVKGVKGDVTLTRTVSGYARTDPSIVINSDALARSMPRLNSLIRSSATSTSSTQIGSNPGTVVRQASQQNLMKITIEPTDEKLVP